VTSAVRTLLLDNYDSFTFNLFQELAEVNDAEPIVVRNDASGWDALRGLDVDNVVISPGPGRPDRSGDFGVCAAAILDAGVPLLGVCLGHQGIGHLTGARVVAAPEVMHGRLSRVHHDGSPLFAGIPQDFEAVRYHSLCVEAPLPPRLRALAWAPDGVLMALAHRTRPLWGVQFHPESVCTEHGLRLLANFRDLTLAAARGRRGGRPPRRAGAPPPARARARRPVRALVERIDGPLDTERAFVGLFGDEPEAFWLDSARPAGRCSRFSFMGAPGGPLSATLTYDVATREVRVRRGEALEVHHETIFEHLDRELARMPRLPELPFEFDGGFVGYFGYELKADCDGDAAHGSSLPDAAFFFADRVIAYDHAERRTYLVALADAAGSAAARRWIRETRRRLAALPPLEPPARPGNGRPPEPVEFRLSRSRERYLDDIRRCQDYLRQGESYEVCLTNRITTTATPDPLALYRTLRRVNPAPFAAFLRFGDAAVVSSSPERFLRVGRDRRAEAKPIKGTVRRGRTPAEDAELAEELRASEKNRAENLMITDLLRNDLGIVCEVGSVTVPRLMAIESFETVHQLVSTIAGRLREDVGPAECIRACFPGGSMTGAPKKRTMEIIDALEEEARGVYSGAIGYLGAGGGTDLNIVIRTVVMDGRRTSIGAGGAIVMQSDPEEELDEMLLKAEAPMRAIALEVSGAPCWRLLDPGEPADADARAEQLAGGAV
jgi:para-aminobenzoate synthetase